MIRRLLLTAVTFLAGAMAVSAQVIMRYGENIDGGYGDASSVISPYVQFSETFVKPYSGCSITKVLIGLNKDATNVYVYIKNNPKDSQPLYRQKVSSLKAGWNEVVLDTPFPITGTEQVAVGYKGSFEQAGGVGCSKEIFADGDIVYYNSKNMWTTTGGSVCVKAVVEGGSLPQNEMMIGRLKDVLVPYNTSEITVSGVVRNVGGNDADGYEIECLIDGEPLTTISVSKAVAVNQSDTFNITVPTTEIGKHLLSMEIGKVNGCQDAYEANNVATMQVTVRDPRFIKRVVCEEFTGTWCGWCPRGLVGLELMKEEYPDQFIPISVHGGQNDPLEISADKAYTYAPFINAQSGAPICNINRKSKGDPYYDIRNLFNMETATESHIAYNMSAEWDADSINITVRSIIMSDVDMRAAKYNIAFTVTEDMVTGYDQVNYYAGGDNGEMYGWEKKTNPTKDFYYNDLARGIFSHYDGDVCIDGDMQAYREYEHEGSFECPVEVADKKNIHVIGQLINPASGFIVNAFSVAPVAAGSTGVSTQVPEQGVKARRQGQTLLLGGVPAGGASVAVYSTDGRLLTQHRVSGGTGSIVLPAAKSLYIVKIKGGDDMVQTLKIR